MTLFSTWVDFDRLAPAMDVQGAMVLVEGDGAVRRNVRACLDSMAGECVWLTSGK
jgi:hypothetical protein